MQSSQLMVAAVLCVCGVDLETACMEPSTCAVKKKRKEKEIRIHPGLEWPLQRSAMFDRLFLAWQMERLVAEIRHRAYLLIHMKRNSLLRDNLSPIYNFEISNFVMSMSNVALKMCLFLVLRTYICSINVELILMNQISLFDWLVHLQDENAIFLFKFTNSYVIFHS